MCKFMCKVYNSILFHMVHRITGDNSVVNFSVTKNADAVECYDF